MVNELSIQSSSLEERGGSSVLRPVCHLTLDSLFLKAEKEIDFEK